MRTTRTTAVCAAAVAVGAGTLAAVASVNAAGQKGAETAKRGATVPFTTIEAEDAEARLGGGARVVTMTGLPAAGAPVTPEMEASGRGFVELSKTGDSLTILVKRAANGITLRHCIPDAPTGGGRTATLSLYVNGQRQKVTLSSKHNWLYGKPSENGQSDDPAAGAPHVYWDEARFLKTGAALKPGDALTLRKDAEDDAAFYRIDLVDLESVPAPLARPAESLSVADFGADGGDAADDTAAILACIAAAKAQKKTVWLPAGTYYQSAKFVLDGVAVRGAGMWHTSLIGNVPEDGSGFAGKLGFSLRGDGPSVRDLYIASDVHTRRPGPGGKPFTAAFNDCVNWRVENVWIARTHVGFWMSGVRNGVARGCRVRLTYADGININRGSTGNLVENCHVRGAGDDGIALLSESDNTPTPSANNTVRSNTVVACWWGHNLDVAGGGGHVVENNLLADNPLFGCLTVNLPGAYPMFPLTGATIRNNTVLRGGGNYAGQRRGAVWLFAGSADARGVVFEDNDILQPVFRAVHVTGGKAQEVTFARNRIDSPGQDAVAIDRSARGSVTLTNNVLTGLKPGALPVASDAAGGALAVTQTGNSWQQ